MKRGVFAAISLGIFVCLLLLGFSDSYAAEKVYSFKFAQFMPSEHIITMNTQEWCKEVERRTNGRVKVTLYPGSTMMPVQQTYDSVTKGIADMGFGIFAYHRGRFPLTEVIDLPLGYKKASVATRMINEYYKKFNPKELADTKVLWLSTHGPGILSLKKPINRLEDIKGLKVRCSGLGTKIVTALGAAPVSLPITDAYDALSKGVAEGLLLDIGGVHNYSLGDVVKYHVENFGSAYVTGFYAVMNKDKWKGLPPDLQKIIDTINAEWIEKAAAVWDQWDANGREAMKKKGNTFIRLSKEEDARWAEKMKPILAEYVQTTKSKGLPGDQALQFCLDYLKKNDK
jgi:TRAP-type C4-dicarboxylate transport system substrate-binding protein